MSDVRYMQTQPRRRYSQLHHYEGGWVPEPDSPAGLRAIAENYRIVPMSEVVAAMGASQPTFDLGSFNSFEAPENQYDYHWAKSKSCQMVSNPRLRRYIEHRLLFDHAMSEKHMSVVCSECYAEFMDRNVASLVTG